jgi:C4-dicarboxylate-specific signal transduction histidine kinase
MQKASTRTDRVDINEAAREMIELTRGEAVKNGVSVKTKFAKGLPIVTGARVQLQQVVLNLILNGLQAMGAGSEGLGSC